MSEYSFEDEQELRVIEYPAGYRAAGIRRTVRAPSEALRGHVDALKEFRDNMEMLLSTFVEEVDLQEKEIGQQIEHGEWFLGEHRHINWDANQMFDRLRLQYVSEVDGLKRERRQLRREKIKQKMAFIKELLDANKELSPFGKLI